MGPYILLGLVALVVVLGIVAIVALVLYFADRNRLQANQSVPAPDVFADVYLVDVVTPCDHSACAQADDITRLQDQIDELRCDHDALAVRFARLASSVSRMTRQVARLVLDSFYIHTHRQYALRTEVDRLSSEVDRLRSPQRWTPSRLAAIIGAIVGALVGWGTLFLVTAHPFTFIQGATQRHFDLNVSHIVFQLVWIALFAIVGAGVAVFGHGLFGRNQEV